MLMECGHCTGSYVRGPWYRQAILIIYRRGRQDPRCAHLQLNPARLVQDVRDDVLVIGHCADHLHHQLPVSHHRRRPVTVVSVFVLEAVVLLVQADDVW